jgi:D-amino peptidase
MNLRRFLSVPAALLIVSTVCLNAQQSLKVFISVDMEGLAGVVNSDHVSSSGSDYNMARRWMTAEANAAIEGALAAGATEIIVNDSHGGMRNILAHELNPLARLITGSPKPMSMMQGLDQTFDAVILIGYHARAGSFDGVLDHTYSSASVYSLKVNSREVGETELNAMIAGHYNVPVVMVAGDKTLSEQIKLMLGPSVVTTVVKESVGRTAAKTLVPEEACKLIATDAKRAIEMREQVTPLRHEGPYRFEIDFLNSAQAENAELIPGVERTSPRSVAFTHTDFIESFRLFRAILLVVR